MMILPILYDILAIAAFFGTIVGLGNIYKYAEAGDPDQALICGIGVLLGTVGVTIRVAVRLFEVGP